MIPGPDHIYKCPHCGAKFLRGSLVSGNTFGAKLFSDGKRIAPMLPDFPVLTKCERCDAILDIKQMKAISTNGERRSVFTKLGLVKPKGENRARFLGIADLYRALEAFPEQELTIRQEIWWKANNAVRYVLERGQIAEDEYDRFCGQRDDRYDENCHALLKLLDPNDQNHRIMMAELHRNLGEFDECVELISGVASEDVFMDRLKRSFIGECQRKNKLLFRIEC